MAFLLRNKPSFRKVKGRLVGYLNQQLVQAYSSPYQFSRRVLLPVVFNLRRLVLLLMDGLTYEVFYLEGFAAGQNRRMKVIYFAEGKGRQYLTHLLFEEGGIRIEKRASLRFWQVPDAADRMSVQADLIIVERNTFLSWKPRLGFWMTAPTWVRMVRHLDLDKSWNEIEQSFKSHTDNIRRFKRAGYTCEISKKPEDFDSFFDQMYVPYVTGRHPGYGLLDTRSHLFSLFQDGFLLFICDAQSRRVAGGLQAIYGEVFFALVVGVLENDPALLKARVVSALEYHLLKWCYENHIRRCDFGEVRPFLADGVYQYKRHWGFSPEKELWNIHEWLFWNSSDSPAVQQWIENHRVIPEFSVRSQIAQS